MHAEQAWEKPRAVNECPEEEEPEASEAFAGKESASETRASLNMRASIAARLIVSNRNATKGGFGWTSGGCICPNTLAKMSEHGAVPRHAPQLASTCSRARSSSSCFGLALVGVGIGSIRALGATPMVSSLLNGFSGLDPRVLLVAVLLVLLALVASYLPARRASMLDPVVALRQP